MVDINIKVLNLTQQSALQYRNYKCIKKNARVFVNFYNFTCNIADHGNMAGLTGSSTKLIGAPLGTKPKRPQPFMHASLLIQSVRVWKKLCRQWRTLRMHQIKLCRSQEQNKVLSRKDPQKLLWWGAKVMGNPFFTAMAFASLMLIPSSAAWYVLPGTSPSTISILKRSQKSKES